MARRKSKGGPRGSRIAKDEETLLIGRNSLRELLKHAPERIQSIFCSLDPDRKHKQSSDIFTLLKKYKVSVEFVDNDYLSKLAQSDSHQSFVALLKARSYFELDTLLERTALSKKALLLFIDSVVDPHNFGAILRAAECFKADGVIWSRNRGASISPVTTKVSVGASELLALAPVANLASALEKVKEKGFWVVGADVGTDSTPLQTFDFPEKTALVLGSEAKGPKALTKKITDFTVKIPMYGAIDSLNVSQAGALLLWSYRVQHSPEG